MKDVYYWIRGTSKNSALVCFHFFRDASGMERVEIEIPRVGIADTGKRIVALWEFCRDMFPISEESANRSKNQHAIGTKKHYENKAKEFYHD